MIKFYYLCSFDTVSFLYTKVRWISHIRFAPLLFSLCSFPSYNRNIDFWKQLPNDESNTSEQTSLHLSKRSPQKSPLNRDIPFLSFLCTPLETPLDIHIHIILTRHAQVLEVVHALRLREPEPRPPVAQRPTVHVPQAALEGHVVVLGRAAHKVLLQNGKNEIRRKLLGVRNQIHVVISMLG